MAMVSAVVLIAIYLIAAFCEFLAPFSPIAFNPRYTYAPPQQLHLFDRDADGPAHPVRGKLGQEEGDAERERHGEDQREHRSQQRAID